MIVVGSRVRYRNPAHGTTPGVVFAIGTKGQYRWQSRLIFVRWEPEIGIIHDPVPESESLLEVIQELEAA